MTQANETVRRGRCVVCDGWFRLTKSGTLWYHRRSLSSRARGRACVGVGDVPIELETP